MTRLVLAIFFLCSAINAAGSVGSTPSFSMKSHRSCSFSNMYTRHFHCTKLEGPSNLSSYLRLNVVILLHWNTLLKQHINNLKTTYNRSTMFLSGMNHGHLTPGTSQKNPPRASFSVRCVGHCIEFLNHSIYPTQISFCLLNTLKFNKIIKKKKRIPTRLWLWVVRKPHLIWYHALLLLPTQN